MNRNITNPCLPVLFFILDIEMMTTMCGTPGYVAPEILKNQQYDKSVDVWSAGVILYILLCGYPPFYEENSAALYRQIKSGAYDYPPDQWNSVSDEAKNLIDSMLVVNPSERLTDAAVLEHPWMKKEDLAGRDIAHVLPYMKKFNIRRKFKAGALAAMVSKAGFSKQTAKK